MLNEIEFVNWIASHKSNNSGESKYAFTLIDGNYYWDDDEEGEHPLRAEELYKMFLEETKKSQFKDKDYGKNLSNSLFELFKTMNNK